jgi:hypothetical protein
MHTHCHSAIASGRQGPASAPRLCLGSSPLPESGGQRLREIPPVPYATGLAGSRHHIFDFLHILADDAASNMQQLHQSDPGWGRLLSQADRRVVVQSKSLAEMLQGTVSKEASQAQEDPEVVRESITEDIVSWWEDEPEDKREELRDALHISRGIPQEVDRQLLLRMRHRLTRALTLPEKKMLREIFRAVALGTHATESPQNTNPLATAPLIEEPI